MMITCILAPFIWILWIVQMIFCILAAVKVSDGGPYRYPVAMRLVK